MNKHQEIYENLTKYAWSDLLTNEHMIDMYREYIEDDPPHFIFNDEYIVEDKLDNFDEMMGERGRAIIFKLYSDISYDNTREVVSRISQFASQFAGNDKIFEIAAWEGEFVDYVNFIDRFINKFKKKCLPKSKKK